MALGEEKKMKGRERKGEEEDNWEGVSIAWDGREKKMFRELRL